MGERAAEDGQMGNRVTGRFILQSGWTDLSKMAFTVKNITSGPCFFSFCGLLKSLF